MDVVLVPVMCKREDSALIRWKLLPIDQCIADLVRALNVAGLPTSISCCGHGDHPGVIGLEDGRALVVGIAGDRPLGEIAMELAGGVLK